MMPGARSRATTWASLAGYALLASGLPLPVGIGAPATRDAAVEKRLAGKDRAVPFPCMDKPCGCATAEQCFADCCCHTPAERLAWARAHRVESHVLEALERRVASADVPAAPPGGCCAAEPAAAAVRPSCCAAADADQGADRDHDDLCRDSRSLATEPDPAPGRTPERAARGPDRVRTVTLKALLACDDITAEWFGLGTAPPPPPLSLSLDGPPVGGVASFDVAPRGDAPAPAAPPPRAA